MPKDRAYDPNRRPSFSDVRAAVIAGKITRAEAKDLGRPVASSGKYDNKYGKPFRTEEEIARKVHKNAGLTEGNW